MNKASSYQLSDIEKLLQVNEERTTKINNHTLNKLLSVKDKISIFKGIEYQDLKAIIYNVKFMKVQKKDFIIKAGNKHDEIYFIFDGKFKVFLENTKVATLKPGDIFGEGGAIFKTTRTTSVVCSSDEATLISFCIDENNMEFCSAALATLYKNLASDINNKLDELDYAYIKK